jgi:hypothetical protein
MPPARRTAVRPRRLGAASVPSAVGELAITLVPVKAAYATPPRRPTATRIAGVHGRVLQPGQPTPGQRRGRARDLRASTRPGTRDPAGPPSGPQAAVLSALRRPRAPAAHRGDRGQGPHETSRRVLHGDGPRRPSSSASGCGHFRRHATLGVHDGWRRRCTPRHRRSFEWTQGRMRRERVSRLRRRPDAMLGERGAGATRSKRPASSRRTELKLRPATVYARSPTTARYGHEACEVFRAGHTTRSELMWNVIVLAAMPVATAADGGDAGPGRRGPPGLRGSPRRARQRAGAAGVPEPDRAAAGRPSARGGARWCEAETRATERGGPATVGRQQDRARPRKPGRRGEAR